MNLVLMSVSLCEQVWFLLLVMILNYKRSSVDDTKLELYLCIYAIVICFVQFNSFYQIRFLRTLDDTIATIEINLISKTPFQATHVSCY